jgi:hypothetical protein
MTGQYSNLSEALAWLYVGMFGVVSVVISEILKTYTIFLILGICTFPGTNTFPH